MRVKSKRCECGAPILKTSKLCRQCNNVLIGKLRTTSLRERIAALTLITPSCWLWQAATDGNGYGWIKVMGRMRGAHRVSWEVHRGAIPEGLCVLHRCDVPNCVNPEHLFLGTHFDNSADKCAKGRAARPVTTKLKDEQVTAIRADTRLLREIAADYGVTPATISKIRLGRTWRGTTRAEASNAL